MQVNSFIMRITNQETYLGEFKQNVMNQMNVYDLTS